MIVGLQPVHQGDARGGLQARIERGAHVVAAGVHVVADVLHQQGLAPRLLDEIVGVTVAAAHGRGLDLEVLGHGGDRFGAGDPTKIGHLGEDHIAAPQRRGLVRHRLIVVRPLRQGGQISHLRQA